MLHKGSIYTLISGEKATVSMLTNSLLPYTKWNLYESCIIYQMQLLVSAHFVYLLTFLTVRDSSKAPLNTLNNYNFVIVILFTNYCILLSFLGLIIEVNVNVYEFFIFIFFRSEWLSDFIHTGPGFNDQFICVSVWAFGSSCLRPK